MPHPFNSIRARLVIVFAFLTAILTALLSTVIGTATSLAVEYQINLRLAETAAEMRDKLDQGMFERYREIGHLASLLSHVGPARERHVQRHLLDQLQATYRDYAWIGITDHQGRVLAATQGVLEGKNVSGRAWARAGLKGPFVSDLHDAILLARLLPGQAGEPLRLVDIAFPLTDFQGQATGVLGVHLSWRWAREVRQSVLQPSMQHDSLEALVLDSASKVILGPPGLLGKSLFLKRQANDTGYQTAIFPDGQAYLIGYAKTRGYRSFPGLGWQVLVCQPKILAFAPLRQLHLQIIGWGLLIGCLFMAMGLLCANWLARPLLRLASAVHERRRDLDAPIPTLDDYQEVALLSGALNEFISSQQSLSTELARSNASLEQRVIQRTAELRHSEEAQTHQAQLLQLILDNMSEGVIAVDRRGQAILVNAAAAKVCVHVPVEEWHAGRAMNHAFFEQDLETPYKVGQLPLTRAIEGHDVSVEEIALKHPAWQEPVWLQVHARPLKDAAGISYGAVLVFRNISEQRAIEQMKNEFVSVVSHELRTPLTSIQGSLGLMRGGLVGDMPDKAVPLLGIALENSDRLIRLINDILDVQKLDAGRMALNIIELDFHQLATRAVLSLQGLETQYDIRFVVQGMPGAWVRADADRLTQAIVNLLSNGAKFSPAGKEVYVQIIEGDAGTWRFSVADCGPGVPADFRERIFGRFAQANAADNRQKGGTGLGLNIARSLIGQMGGDIGFESEPHVCTRFFIELPAITPAQADSVIAPATGVSQSR